MEQMYAINTCFKNTCHHYYLWSDNPSCTAKQLVSKICHLQTFFKINACMSIFYDKTKVCLTLICYVGNFFFVFYRSKYNEFGSYFDIMFRLWWSCSSCCPLLCYGNINMTCLAYKKHFHCDHSLWGVQSVRLTRC